MRICSFFLFSSLLVADSSVMTKERLLEERTKRVVELEHAMAQIKKQLDDHVSGLKEFDERRLKSLNGRLHSYKGQIYENSRILSEEEIEVLLGTYGTQSGEL